MATDIAYQAPTTGSRVPVSVAKPLPVSLTNAATGVALNVSDPSYVRLLNSGALKVGAGTLDSMSVGAPGTTITVTITDSLDSSGTVIFGPITLVAGYVNPFGNGLAFGIGAYAAFSATTGTPNVTFGVL